MLLKSKGSGVRATLTIKILFFYTWVTLLSSQIMIQSNKQRRGKAMKMMHEKAQIFFFNEHSLEKRKKKMKTNLAK